MAILSDFSAETLLSLIDAKSNLNAGRAALAIKTAGQWTSIGYLQLSHAARDLSCYLMEQGVQTGDRIVIVADPGPEWGIAFFAALHTGCLVVPLDPKLTTVELEAIFEDCSPRVVFCSQGLASVVQSLQSQCPSLSYLYTLGPQTEAGTLPHIHQLQPKQLYPGRDRGLTEDALLLYTSGTTGQPKGVLLSFGSIVFEARVLEGLMKLSPRDQLLSILPLNHLLELTCGFMSVLNAGGCVDYAQTLLPDEILALMREKRVTFMVTVPLFLKLLKGAIEREIASCTGLTGFFLKHRELLSRWAPHPKLRQMIYGPLHQRLGGRLRGLVCGGAPLEEDLARFFDTLGIPIYHGYGLTETGPVIAANSPGRYRLGSVGKPLPGVEMKICPKTEEIWTRGPHLMNGYYRHPEWTREALDTEGWFRTGDRGHLDADGFLYITGRSKSLIVLGAGKKVQPEEVEALLMGSSQFKEVCVLGQVAKTGLHQGNEQVCAVVVLAVEGLSQEAVEAEVAQQCQALAPYKRPTQIVVWPGELPKTATRKIKREEVSRLLAEPAGSVSSS